MRRRRDQIGDSGTGVIILRDGYGHQGGGRLENGFYRALIHKLSASKAFARLAPGVPEQGSMKR